MCVGVPKDFLFGLSSLSLCIYLVSLAFHSLSHVPGRSFFFSSLGNEKRVDCSDWSLIDEITLCYRGFPITFV